MNCQDKAHRGRTHFNIGIIAISASRSEHHYRHPTPSHPPKPISTSNGIVINASRNERIYIAALTSLTPCHIPPRHLCVQLTQICVYSLPSTRQVQSLLCWHLLQPRAFIALRPGAADVRAHGSQCWQLGGLTIDVVGLCHPRT